MNKRTGLLTMLVLVLALLLGLTVPVGAVEPGEAIVKYFNTEETSEFILNRSEITGSDSWVQVTFYFEVYDDDAYFVSAWARAVGEQEGLQITLDGVILPEPVPFLVETEWQSITLAGPDQQPAPVFLTAGEHELTFGTVDTVAPHIDQIRVSRDYEASLFPADEYRVYLDEVDAAVIPDDHYYKDEIPEEVSAAKAQVMKASFAPQSDYMYDLGLGFTYTYYGYYYLTAGQQVQFETYNPNPWGSDPVMYLFNYYNPSAGSWSNDDGAGGFQSRIIATPPATGWYMLLLRGYGNSAGYSDIRYNGRIVVSRAVIGGRYDYCDALSKTGELNYFTAYLSGDSRLWVMDSSSFPGLVKAQNDDYWGSGNFYWGLASRIKATISPQVRYAILGTYSAWQPTATADVYLKLSNSTIMPYFPNLKADDAIRSAPASGTYNCISWTGYITSYWVWPPSPASPWYNANPLTAFDNYYGNNPQRYAGACNYSRSGATVWSSVIDLWALNGSYTHGSIRKPGCGYPHGYDWESKPGSLMRTFHPRNALSGNSYGQVDKYYIRVGKSTSSCKTLAESVEAGLTVLDVVDLDPAEQARLRELLAAVPLDVRIDVNTYYERWKETWSDPEVAIHSDPRRYAQSQEYAELIEVCQAVGEKAWPLMLARFVSGDLLAFNAIEDLTFDRHGELMEQIRTEGLAPESRFDANGAYIAPSMDANMMRYVKRLLPTL